MSARVFVTCTDIVNLESFFEVALSEPTQNLRGHTGRAIARLEPKKRRSLRSAFVAVGAHEGVLNTFVWYHRIHTITRTPTGYTFTSSFAFVHRVRNDSSPILTIWWDHIAPSDHGIQTPPPTPPPRRNLRPLI